MRNVLCADAQDRSAFRQKRREFARVGLACGLPSPDWKESDVMSQKTVQLTIGRLMTEEDLRLRFVEHPRATLADLREQGFELTDDEIDALARSDPKAWPSMANRIHPWLQCCSLRLKSRG
jgi:hypothetical protein